MTQDETCLTDLQKEALKALTQDYTSVRQENTAHIQLYKTQERYGTALVAVAGLFIPLLFGVSVSAQGVADMQKLVTPGTVLLASFVISTVLFHMYFSTLANLFALQVLAERCVLLEEEINRILSGQYLVWERLTTLIWSKMVFPFIRCRTKL